MFINPHQRCGYSDSPFARKDTFLYCRIQKWIGGGGRRGDTDTKKKLYPRKIQFFVLEKYVEDAKQHEKDVPDLLEAIMRPTCLVKEALRRNLMNMCQFRSKITKIRVSTFGCRKSDGFPPEANTTSENSKF